MPARRLSALDLDLQAKKNRAEFRHAQAAQRARKEQQLASEKLKEEARKERIETLIGGKTRVTIPDLHRVPLRPIRNLQQSPPEAVVVSPPKLPSGSNAPTEAIDQFGNPVPNGGELVGQVPEEIVRQVSYEQPIFSSPAIAPANSSPAIAPANSSTAIATPSSSPAVAAPGSSNVRRIPKPVNPSPLVGSGFSATQTDGSNTAIALPEEAAGSMADPFDANYFNRRFATPAVDNK